MNLLVHQDNHDVLTKVLKQNPYKLMDSKTSLTVCHFSVLSSGVLFSAHILSASQAPKDARESQIFVNVQEMLTVIFHASLHYLLTYEAECLCFLLNALRWDLR